MGISDLGMLTMWFYTSLPSHEQKLEPMEETEWTAEQVFTSMLLLVLAVGIDWPGVNIETMITVYMKLIVVLRMLRIFRQWFEKININAEITKGFLLNVWSGIICLLAFLRMGSLTFFFLSSIACWSSEREFCYLGAIRCDLFTTSDLCLRERRPIFFEMSLLFPLFFFFPGFLVAICLKAS